MASPEPGERERDVANAQVVEFVVFDPHNLDTYPSVCVDRDEVYSRFGFLGGELLIFSSSGAYIGQVVKQIGETNEGS